MSEVEITEIPPLSPGEQSIVDFHSVVNIVSVLNSELLVLGLTLANDENLFARSLAACLAILDSLADRERALRQAAGVAELERAVFAEIAERTAGRALGPEFEETLANVRSVFAILKVRARELLARAAAPERWEVFDPEALRRDFVDALAAIERNSHGRYRILYDAALRGPNDYCVDLRIECAGGALVMPPVLQDVMRDLIANARKYTPQGGQILAALQADAQGVRVVVRDEGKGIPPEEIRAVVAFGKRASNVDSVRTMGGGFGLTKAFLVTKQFGGRFWIASALGLGTQVRLWIPRPT